MKVEDFENDKKNQSNVLDIQKIHQFHQYIKIN